ncbi:22851_t:CDS:2, partial [Dentiscutata erythropus]
MEETKKQKNPPSPSPTPVSISKTVTRLKNMHGKAQTVNDRLIKLKETVTGKDQIITKQ